MNPSPLPEKLKNIKLKNMNICKFRSITEWIKCIGLEVLLEMLLPMTAALSLLLVVLDRVGRHQSLVSEGIILFVIVIKIGCKNLALPSIYENNRHKVWCSYS